jgi:hypothetical protein
MAFDFTGITLSNILSNDLAKKVTSSSSAQQYWQTVSSDFLNYIQNYFPSTYPSDTLSVTNNIYCGGSYYGDGSKLSNMSNNITLTASTVIIPQITQNTTYICNPIATQTIDITAGATAGITVTFLNPSNYVSTVTLKTGITYPLQTQNSLVVSWDGTVWEIITQAQGAAIGAWTAYTPNFTNFGTPTNVEFYWRRVGQNCQINGKFTAGTTVATTAAITLPVINGVQMSVDTNLITLIHIFGAWTRSDVTGQNGMNTIIIDPTSPSYFYFSLDFTTSTFGFNKLTGTWVTATGNSVGVQLEFPVLGWGSNINLVTDFQEFASNSNSGVTAGTTYATGMVQGPAGSPILSVASTTVTGASVTGYNVNWIQAITPQDLFFVEFQDTSLNTWRLATDTEGGITFQAGAAYGVRYISTGTYTGRVDFGNGGQNPSGQASFAAYGTAWSNMSGRNWRVRKVSNGNWADVSQGNTTVNGNLTITGITDLTGPINTYLATGIQNVAWVNWFSPVAGESGFIIAVSSAGTNRYDMYYYINCTATVTVVQVNGGDSTVRSSGSYVQYGGVSDSTMTYSALRIS